METTAADKLDPRFREAFYALPKRVQKGIEEGNPLAVRRLYALYELRQAGAPNRAARRRRR